MAFEAIMHIDTAHIIKGAVSLGLDLKIKSVDTRLPF